MLTIDNYINGRYAPPQKGVYLNNINPAIGRTYSRVANSTAEDLEAAMAAAESAYPLWCSMPLEERSAILHRLANLIEQNLDKMAAAESLDTGKPIALARAMDIPRAAKNLRFFASAIINEPSQAHIMEGQAVNYTRRAPLGIVGCISPWNLPLYLFTWKIAPALAAGNCVIGKPSEITPYTAYLLGELATEAGLPSGVLNILHGKGPEIGHLIVNHPVIKAISFTGGTHTGKTIAQSAAQHLKKVSLELGGKNPVLVFDDCDLEKAVTTSVQSAFANQGEICLCGSRIFIQQSIYQSFKKSFIAAVKQLTVGLPTTDVDLGAIVSNQHLKKIKTYVQQAITDGGKVLTGGHEVPLGRGFFFEPTVIEGLDECSTINQEEVFGPVVTLMPFDDMPDAVLKSNASPYGLASVIWTNDLQRAHLLAHQLHTGIVWVNCWMLRDLRTPFGGMKASGIGREGGSEALRFFTETQNICIKL